MAKVVMYSKVPCPYCVHAKRLLIEKEIEFDEIDVTDQNDKIMELKNKWGWATLPIIIINDKLVGGFTDLRDLNESGKLDELLKQ